MPCPSIPWENTQVDHMEPLISEGDMLLVKVSNECGYTRSISSVECCTEKFRLWIAHTKAN